MLNRRLTAFLSAMLLVVFPASMSAAGPYAGNLRTTGNVMVDGKASPQSNTVFPGDRIQTAANATATLTTDGSTVLLAGNTSVIFGQNVLDLSCGSAMVTTTSGMSVRVAGITITPATPSAKFEVAQGGKALSIADQQGSLSIQDGHGTRTMQPGETTTLENSNAGCGPISKEVPPGSNWPANAAVVGTAAATGVLVYCSVNRWCDESPDDPD